MSWVLARDVLTMWREPRGSAKKTKTEVKGNANGARVKGYEAAQRREAEGDRR